jgi:hypothetical protein
MRCDICSRWVPMSPYSLEALRTLTRVNHCVRTTCRLIVLRMVGAGIVFNVQTIRIFGEDQPTLFDN